MVQKAGKFGRLQVTKLQIYYGGTQAETTLFSFEELRTFRLANDQICVLVIGKSKDCNSSKENNVVSTCVTP